MTIAHCTLSALKVIEAVFYCPLIRFLKTDLNWSFLVFLYFCIKQLMHVDISLVIWYSIFPCILLWVMYSEIRAPTLSCHRAPNATTQPSSAFTKLSFGDIFVFIHFFSSKANSIQQYNRGAFFAWRAPNLSWSRIMWSQARMLRFLEPSREMP